MKRRDFDLDYVNDIALMHDNAQTIQRKLDRLAIELSRHGMDLGPSKCKVLFQDWQDHVPALTLHDG